MRRMGSCTIFPNLTGMEDVVVLGRYCGRMRRHHLDFLTGLNEKSRFFIRTGSGYEWQHKSVR